MGLGRLTVQSALGEPLRAEIDISAISPEEAASLRSRVSPPEAFRAAGAEFNAALSAASVTLQRRADGRYFLRLVSDRAVQEPFIDVILDVEWSSGRLSREFTMLFDLPLTRAVASTPAPVAMAAAPVPAQPVPLAPSMAPAVRPAPASGPGAAPDTASRVNGGTAVTAKAPAAAATRPAPGAAGGRTELRVQAGDTLSRIAGQNLAPGVSLDQMLVALYRGNAEAFIGDNMNRLRVGAVLSMPSADTALAITPAAAREVIQAQSADFGSYRSRLAGSAPVAVPDSGRSAAGSVEVRVQDRKTTAAAAPDRLTLSKGALAAGKGSEEATAKQREQDDTAARVAELARNVDDLKKLKGVAVGSAAVAGSASAAASSAMALPVAPPLPTSEPAASAAQEATAASAAVQAASAAPASPVEAAAAAAPKASAPATAATTEAATEVDFLADLLANPLLLPVGGVLAALMAGLGLYWMRKRVKDDGGETSFMESRLRADSFFGASGGQHVDTLERAGSASSMNFSLSQLDAIGDVDPVAEADVYLAYGRDLQAEEILKEAMRVNPGRMPIRLKLLEVYAKRRDTQAFEVLATRLHTLSGGRGDDWAMAQELGASIDPRNPLYLPGGTPSQQFLDSAAAVDAVDAKSILQSIQPTPSRFALESAATASVAAAEETTRVERAARPPASSMPAPAPAVQSLPSQAVPAESLSFGLDLDLDMPDPGAPVPLGAAPSRGPQAEAPTLHPLATEPEPTLDFELPAMNLEPGARLEPALSAPTESPDPLGLLSLDMPDGDAGLEPINTATDVEADEALGRKLELADEFRQIGDVEGARELLQEVIAQSSGALQSKAESMLRSLS